MSKDERPSDQATRRGRCQHCGFSIEELPCYHCGRDGFAPAPSWRELQRRERMVDELIRPPSLVNVPDFRLPRLSRTWQGHCAACGKNVPTYPCAYCKATGLPPPLARSPYLSDAEPTFSPEIIIVAIKPRPQALRNRLLPRIPTHQFTDEEIV
jgi:hypothetical protein